MDVTIPLKTQDLKHHIKNYAGCASLIFGQDSTIHRSLEHIQEHIEDNENNYTYEFKEESLFGGHFLDRINYIINKFLESCASGNHSNIDTKKLDFSDYLEQVENREYCMFAN